MTVIHRVCHIRKQVTRRSPHTSWSKHLPVILTAVLKNSSRMFLGAGEEEHLLLFQNIQVQFPASTWWITKIHNSRTRGSDTFLLPGVPGTRVAYTHMCS